MCNDKRWWEIRSLKIATTSSFSFVRSTPFFLCFCSFELDTQKNRRFILCKHEFALIFMLFMLRMFPISATTVNNAKKYRLLFYGCFYWNSPNWSFFVLSLCVSMFLPYDFCVHASVCMRRNCSYLLISIGFPSINQQKKMPAIRIHSVCTLHPSMKCRHFILPIRFHSFFAL